MIADINSELAAYRDKWQRLVSSRTNTVFFEQLIPAAVGWKVADLTDFDTAVTTLREYCDLVVHTRLNNRWIAKMVLRDDTLGLGAPVIKIMQVRPGSKDPLGLDHLDFYSPKSPDEIEQTLRAEGVKWSHETNHDGDDYPWASIWFDNTEAKIKHYSVLDIYADQLRAVSRKIRQAE